MANPILHNNCESLAGLVGAWRGHGSGEYPTIAPFEYVEEATFGHGDMPFLTYSQGTRHTGDGRRLHSEVGYWRPVSSDRLEVVLSHPTGVCEILEGPIDAGVSVVFDLHSIVVAGTASAKEVTAVHRHIELEGDTLRYEIAMAAVGVPLTHHLSAELKRVSD